MAEKTERRDMTYPNDRGMVPLSDDSADQDTGRNALWAVSKHLGPVLCVLAFNRPAVVFVCVVLWLAFAYSIVFATRH